jgi:alpha-tubulin suppressor-like RCC1 family protein
LPEHSVRQVAVGGQSICALTEAGQTQCWGTNTSGQLGDATTISRRQPAPIGAKLSLESITAGRAHFCGLDNDGRAYCWGDNRFGQVGDGSRQHRLEPVPVDTKLRFEAIFAGDAHTCGQGSGDTLHCWGRNHRGQLGDGSFEHRLTPTAVDTEISPSAVTLGHSHTCAFDATQGEVWCWGLDVGRPQVVLQVDALSSLESLSRRGGWRSRSDDYLLLVDGKSAGYVLPLSQGSNLLVSPTPIDLSTLPAFAAEKTDEN